MLIKTKIFARIGQRYQGYYERRRPDKRSIAASALFLGIFVRQQNRRQNYRPAQILRTKTVVLVSIELNTNKNKIF